MAWIEYHTELRDHWKIQRFADAQNIAYPHALGLISCLWLWAVNNAPAGNVTKFNDVELCRAARSTSVFEIKKILTECELLDDKGCINDWRKHGIKYLESTKLRMRRYRNAQRNRYVTVRSTLPNLTLPNLKTKKEAPLSAASKIPANPKELTPIQKVITVYKNVSGFRDDPAWDKTFFPRHTRSAKALIGFIGNWKDAADCIQDTYEKIKAWNPEAEISIDTILTKHAAAWLKDKREREAKRGVLSMPSNGSLPLVGRTTDEIADTREKGTGNEGV